MGIINRVTCKNKNCHYSLELYEGPGMKLFAYLKETEKKVLSREIDLQELKEKLLKGGKLMIRGIYLCPSCQKFLNDNSIYLMENITYSPFGTLRYDISFPFGTPVCKDCNTELVYIDNVRSSKVKCPKCGSDLNARIAGHVD